jgi:hypothetical protein
MDFMNVSLCIINMLLSLISINIVNMVSSTAVAMSTKKWRWWHAHQRVDRAMTTSVHLVLPPIQTMINILRTIISAGSNKRLTLIKDSTTLDQTNKRRWWITYHCQVGHHRQNQPLNRLQLDDHSRITRQTNGDNVLSPPVLNRQWWGGPSLPIYHSPV